MPRTYEGGCLCGHVRFVAEGSPLKPHSCSCKMCQRHSGAVMLHWVEFPAEKVRWSNRPAVWRSSDCSSRSFCPKCGSTLGAIDDKPVVALVLGSFDSSNRKELIPQYHSYVGQRARWLRE